MVINISRVNSLFNKRSIFQTVSRKAYAVNCELLHHLNYLGLRSLNGWATMQASIIVLPILNGGHQELSYIQIPQTTHHSASGHQNTLRSTHQHIFRLSSSRLSVHGISQCSLQQDGESLDVAGWWYFLWYHYPKKDCSWSRKLNIRIYSFDNSIRLNTTPLKCFSQFMLII